MEEPVSDITEAVRRAADYLAPQPFDASVTNEDIAEDCIRSYQEYLAELGAEVLMPGEVPSWMYKPTAAEIFNAAYVARENIPGNWYRLSVQAEQS